MQKLATMESTALFVLLLFLFSSTADCQSQPVLLSIQPTPTLKFETNPNWAVVDDDWPKQSNEYNYDHDLIFLNQSSDDSKQFFFLDSTATKNVYLKFGSKFLQRFNDKNGTIEMRFHLWIASSEQDKQITINVGELIKFNTKDYKNKWILVRFQLDFTKLSTFYLNYENNQGYKTLVIIKDVYVKHYQTILKKPAKSMLNVDLPKLQSYCFPQSLANNEPIIFSDCSTERGSKCKLSWKEKDKKKERTVSLKYWAMNGSQLSINGKELGSKSDDQYFIKVDTLKITDNYLQFGLKILSNNICTSLAIEIDSIDGICSSTKDCAKVFDTSQSSSNLIDKKIITLINQTESSSTNIYHQTSGQTGQFKYQPSSNVTSINHLCLNIDLMTPNDLKMNIQMILDISYRLGGSNFEQSIYRNQIEMETPSMSLPLCLKDYVNIESTNYTIIMRHYTLKVGNDLPTIIFYVSELEKDGYLLEDNNNDQDVSWLNLLAVAKQDGASSSLVNNSMFRTMEHLSNVIWNVNTFEFRRYFKLDEDIIIFNDKATTFEKRAFLSTNWIRYDENLMANGLVEYQLKIESVLDNILQLYPMICNQVGQCSSLAANKVDINCHNDGCRYKFRLPAIYIFQQFRLVFVFEYQLPAGDQICSITVQLSLTQFPNPCVDGDDKNVCQNGAICSKNILAKIDDLEQPLFICDCPHGFEGELCEQKNYCLMKETHGDEVCSKHGLHCQNVPNGFKCQCKEVNQIIWDTNKKNCIRSKPIVSNFGQNLTDLPLALNYSTLNDQNAIVYDFQANDLPKGQDLCFYVNAINVFQEDVRKIDDIPAWFVYVTINNQPEALLYRHAINNHNEWKCLGLLLLEPILLFDVKLTLRFQVNTFLMKNSFDLNKLAHQVKIEAIEFKLEDLKTKSNDYNEQYLKNVMLKNWDMEMKENMTNNGKLADVWKQIDNGKEFTTSLISDIFLNVGTLPIIRMDFLHNKRCHLDVGLSLIYHDNTIKHMILELKEQPKTSDSQTNHTFFGVGTYLSTPGKPFQLRLDLYGHDCTLVQLRLPIEVSENKCRSSSCENDGQCQMNYHDGTTSCKCNEFTGDRCEIAELCNTNQLKQYCSAMIHGPEGKSKCQTISNGTFSCTCWPGLFEWDAASGSCLPIFQHQLLFEHFDPESSLSFFDNVIKIADNQSNIDEQVFRWMTKKDYWTKSLEKPYYFALTKKPSPLIAKLFSLANNAQDYCIKLDYFLLNDGQFGLAVDDEELLFTNEIRGGGDSDETQLCLRQFKSNLEPPEKVKFGAFGEFVSFRVKSYEMFNFTANLLTYISNNADGIVKEADWPIRFPSNVWSFKGEIIEFVETSMNNPSQRHSYLLSAWINYAQTVKHRFRFQIDSSELSNCLLQPIVFDDKMRDISRKVIRDFSNGILFGDPKMDKKAKKPTTLISIELSSISTNFRVGFYIQTKGAQKINLKISHVDLDDYCYDKNSKLITCFKQGECINLPSKASYRCQCNVGFMGGDCSAIDYCHTIDKTLKKTGEMLCHELLHTTHQCNNIKDSFECACQPNYAWNAKMRTCDTISTCLTEMPCDLGTEDCIDLITGGYNCTCKEGLERNPKTGKCLLHDPCMLAVECGTGSKCLATGNGNDHICYCPEGYYREHDANTGKYICTSLACSPFTNQCEHKCEQVNNDNGYKCSCYQGYHQEKERCVLDTRRKDEQLPNCLKWTNTTKVASICQAEGSYCDSVTGRCACTRVGFEYIEVTNQKEKFSICSPKENLFIRECPYGNSTIVKTKDGQHRVACWCDGQLYRLNETTFTCDIVPICMTKGLECSHKQAICLPDVIDINKYQCRCEPGQHLNSSSVCVDHCDDSRIIEKCTSRGGRCNPLLFTDNWELNLSKLIIEEICLCLEGLVASGSGNNFHCVPAQEMLYSSINIEKLTYNISNLFEKFIDPNQYLRPNSVHQVEYFDSVYSSPLALMPSKNLEQYLQVNKILDNANRAKVFSGLKKLEQYQVQHQLDNLFLNLIKHDDKLKAQVDELRVLNCTGVEDETRKDIDCIIQLAAKSGEAQMFVKLIQNQLNEKCKQFKSKNSSETLCIIMLERKDDKLNDFLLLNHQSINQISFKPFQQCEKNGYLCPRYTRCVDDRTKIASDVLFECHCLNSTILEKGRMQKNAKLSASIQSCAVSSNVDICSTYCRKIPYTTGACQVSQLEDDHPLVSINCTCNEKALSIESNRTNNLFDNAVLPLNQCVDKGDYFCSHFKCDHGTCVGEMSMCVCLNGWIDKHCDKEDTIDDKIKLLTYALIGLGALMVIFIIFTIGCCYFNRKRSIDSDDDSENSESYELPSIPSIEANEQQIDDNKDNQTQRSRLPIGRNGTFRIRKKSIDEASIDSDSSDKSHRYKIQKVLDEATIKEMIPQKTYIKTLATEEELTDHTLGIPYRERGIDVSKAFSYVSHKSSMAGPSGITSNRTTSNHSPQASFQPLSQDQQQPNSSNKSILSKSICQLPPLQPVDKIKISSIKKVGINIDTTDINHSNLVTNPAVKGNVSFKIRNYEHR